MTWMHVRYVRKIENFHIQCFQGKQLACFCQWCGVPFFTFVSDAIISKLRQSRRWSQRLVSNRDHVIENETTDEQERYQETSCYDDIRMSKMINHDTIRKTSQSISDTEYCNKGACLGASSNTEYNAVNGAWSLRNGGSNRRVYSNEYNLLELRVRNVSCDSVEFDNLALTGDHDESTQSEENAYNTATYGNSSLNNAMKCPSHSQNQTGSLADCELSSKRYETTFGFDYKGGNIDKSPIAREIDKNYELATITNGDAAKEYMNSETV